MSQNIPSWQLWSRNIDEVYEILQEVFGDDQELEIIELIKDELKNSTQRESTVVIDDENIMMIIILSKLKSKKKINF